MHIAFPMIRSPTPSGNEPVNFTARDFSLQDASFLARVPEGSLRNWIHRSVMKVGQKHRLTGRYYFNVKDILRLTVMHDLCVRRGMSFNPSDAVRIADAAVTAALENAAQPRDGFRKNLNVIIGWHEDGEMFVTTADIKHPGNYYPPVPQSEADEIYSPLRRTIVAVPCAVMLRDIVIRCELLQKRNAKAEAPTHA